ncbi:Carbohydrate sulfotransferase 8 [Oopsacas minuta]|uniref:Carbohydrate sulfotransferase n=1 Tax=Oopsacas minuta TaxID=111878 RepID=A0AAV7KIY6_9METZ|nr:Carbohydrate sulfotransferase 8 [Oopsacas minuta]
MNYPRLQFNYIFVILVWILLTGIFTIIFLSSEQYLKEQIPLYNSVNVPTILNTSSDSWIEYRDNWDGDILIETEYTNRQIHFTQQYVDAMIKKGVHPLTQIYPKFLERIEFVNKTCQKLPEEINYKLLLRALNFMQFNDDFELIHCLVPKASSDTWTKQFAKMVVPNLAPSRDFVNKISLSNYFEEQRETARRIQTYTKFFIHRHPFERLVSGYRNKFQDPPKFWFVNTYAKAIIISNYLKKYPHDRQSFERQYTYLPDSEKQHILKQIDRLSSAEDKFGITFIEFLNYVIDTVDEKGVDEMNMHWKPVSRICNPCAVHFDIMIEHDNVSEESQLLVDYVQKNKATNPRLYFEEFEKKATRDKCNQYFSDIPQNIRQRLFEIFRNDFILFDYKYDLESKDFLCQENTNN